MLKKQNIANRIESLVMESKVKENKVIPGPVIMQVVTAKSVSDGLHDFPCHFTCESFRKGSYLRVVRWEVDLTYSRLIIHDAQYLGGSGCDVKHGKKWDVEKLKTIVKSKHFFKNFGMIFEKSSTISQPQAPFEELSFDRLKKCFRSHSREM